MNTSSSQTSESWLTSATARLAKAGISTARLDCLVLLEDVTDQDRGWLLAHPELPIKGSTLQQLENFVERRIKHEPLAYIRGKSEFYGREFSVNAATLQPRPETETMIDLLKELIYISQNSSLLEIGSLTDGENVKCAIVDVGTGSGCLAISVKSELPKADVYGTEINPEALRLAKQNAKKLGAKVVLRHGDLLNPLPVSIFGAKMSVILANLPYVPDSHTINEAAMYEPRVAIFGGSDGLDIYRRLFLATAVLLQKPHYILTESLPFQHKALAKIAKKAEYKLRLTDDFIQVFVLNNSLQST